MPSRDLRAMPQRSITAVAPTPVISVPIRLFMIVSMCLPSIGTNGRVPLQVNLKSRGARDGHCRGSTAVRPSGVDTAFLRGKGIDLLRRQAWPAPTVRLWRAGAVGSYRAGARYRFFAG